MRHVRNVISVPPGVCDLCSGIDVDAIQSYRKVTDHGESLPGTTLRHSIGLATVQSKIRIYDEKGIDRAVGATMQD
jgi:hypothetical protein